MKRVGIIGGGLGGLASACVLAARGHEVVLFERNDWLGGKAAVLEQDGFRFDMGPTILTLPSVLRRIFAEACQDVDDALDLIPLDRPVLIAAHPELADDLRSFFHNHDSIGRLAVPLKAAVDAPTLLGLTETGPAHTGITVRYFLPTQYRNSCRASPFFAARR